MKHLIVMGLCMFSLNVLAEDTTLKQKAEEAGNDTRRAGREAVRTTKEKTCEMVNGKMECTAQKVKHSVQRAGDKVEDAID